MIKRYKKSSIGEKQATEHFKYREFASRESESFKVDEKLPLYLEAIMYKVKAESAVINSGYRTPDESVNAGGSRTDKHTQGMAADVVFYDNSGKVISPVDICLAVEDMGFIGGCARIGNTAVHIDTRPIEEKYWGDETKGTSSIWNFGKRYKSYYDYFGKKKAKEKIVKYKTKQGVFYRTEPFKADGNKAGSLKKGKRVKVVKGGRVEYNGTIFYKMRRYWKYYWINKDYLVKK